MVWGCSESREQIKYEYIDYLHEKNTIGRVEKFL